MSSLRDINLFKLTTIVSNFNTKISTIGEYNEQYEVLCLVQENNEILFRRSDKFGKVAVRLLCWFSDTSRTVQDICFQPAGPNVLILCYDNTIHTVSLVSLFDEQIHPYAEIIISYIIPFIGPHECPNAKTCPNNYENSNSNQSSISCRSIEDPNSDAYSTKKIDEFIQKNVLYNNIYTDTSPAVVVTEITTGNQEKDNESDVEVISDKSGENNSEGNDESIKKLSKASTFDGCKTYSTSLESSSYPCPYPTCCLWWQTLSLENRAIVGYSDGTICFVGLSPNCPFIANTAIEKGAIEKLIICKDSCFEIISLMITTSVTEQWKLLLEQKAIGYTFPGDIDNFSGPSISTEATTNNKDKDGGKTSQIINSEIEEDWQFLISLIQNTQNEVSTTGTSSNLSPLEKDIPSTSKSAQGGIIPSAIARIASLKDFGEKKIGELKFKLALSRLKSSEKLGKPKLEPTVLAVIDAPTRFPEILTTPSGPFFSVQFINNKYLLTALHSYSDTLSVHSMDITLIPLFLYKIPKNSKSILLTKNLIYAIQYVYIDPNINVPQSVTVEDKENEVNNTNKLEDQPKATNNTSRSTTSEISQEINVLNVISCRMSSKKIDDNSEFNEKSLLAQFSFPSERIISIHRRCVVYDKQILNELNNFEQDPKTTGKGDDDKTNDFYYLKAYNNIRNKLEESENFDVTDVRVMTNKFPDIEYERCFIITDKNVYSIDLSDYPHVIFLNLANTSSWPLCEDFCNTFNISLPQCIEFAGDVFLKRKKVTQALSTFNIARIPPIYTAMKLAMFCECNALMHLCATALKMRYLISSKYPVNHHIKDIINSADKRIELYSKYKIEIPKVADEDVNSGRSCSDFSYENDELSNDSKITNTSLFHLSNYLFLTLCERSIRDRQFLPLWNFLVINSRYHSYLASVVLSESGLYSSAVLLAKTRGVALTVFYCLVKIANTDPDEYFDIGILMYNLSDEIFMECISYLYTIAHDYFLVIKKHINSFDDEILERLERQINPFNEVYRPIIMKLSDLYTNGEDNAYRKEYIDWYRSLVETYIIILIKLKTSKNPETNFLHGLSTFQMKYEEELTASNIDFCERFSAGFSYGVCIINRVAYMWGFNGIHPNFDVKSLDLDKSESAHTPKELSFFVDLNLDVLSVKCGRTHFLLETTSGVYAVGGNSLGQLGVGNHMSQSPHPMLIRFFEGKKVGLISAGQYHNAVVADGNLYTWGWGIFGQLGHGNIENLYLPRQVNFFCDKKIKQISSGYSHTLVLCEDNLYVFGSNHFGQLGIGQYVPSYLMYAVGNSGDPPSLRTTLKKMLSPVPFDLDSDNQTEKIKFVHTHYFSNLLVTNQNNLYVWGLSPQSLRLASQAKKRAKQSQQKTEDKNEDNKSNQNGAGGDQPEIIDQKVLNEACEINEESKDKEDLDSGEEEKENDNQEEDSSDHYFPKKVDTSEVEGDIVQVSSGLYHYALITSKNGLYTWGKNLERQLGHEGSRSDVVKPTQLDVVSNPLHVQCGGDFTLVMTKDYIVKAFGNNNSAQCGKEISWKDYSGRLVRLKSSKRLVRIPDGSQYIQTPVDIQLPKQDIEDCNPIAYLKNLPKFKREYLTSCNLYETLLDLETHNATIDSNLNELCIDSICDETNQLTLDKNNENIIENCQSNDNVTTDHSSGVQNLSNQTLKNYNINHDSNEKTDLNDLIHYCLFIFNGLYDHKIIIENLKENQIEYKIRMLMFEYKFLDAFKLIIQETPTPFKTIKIFEYFTKDSNIFPMHTEELKYFVYELFLNFILKKFNIEILEEFLLKNLDVYLIHIAYVLYFNNNNNYTTELERSVLSKYKNLFTNIDNNDDSNIKNHLNHNNNLMMDNCDLIFKSVSSKFTIIICQKIIETGNEN